MAMPVPSNTEYFQSVQYGPVYADPIQPAKPIVSERPPSHAAQRRVWKAAKAAAEPVVRQRVVHEKPQQTLWHFLPFVSTPSATQSVSDIELAAATFYKASAHKQNRTDLEIGMASALGNKNIFDFR